MSDVAQINVLGQGTGYGVVIGCVSLLLLTGSSQSLSLSSALQVFAASS